VPAVWLRPGKPASADRIRYGGEQVGVKWGFLSTANINRLALAGARESDRVDVFAVASRDERRAQEYARANGFERAYGSYEALLADPDVEAVYISLPNSLHVEWSVRALEAGKHVLCEKPFDRRPAEVERAFDVAEREGRLLMEAFMFRHNPQTAKLTELIDAGAIGALRVVRACFSFTIEDPENVRLAADLDGGALMDVGSYCVSGSRLLAGEPLSVYGEQVVGRSGVDTRFFGTLRFPGGVVSQFDCGFDLPSRDELEAIGAEGSIFLDDPWHCRTPRIELRRNGDAEAITVGAEDSYRLELDNLSDAVRGEAEPLLGREDAVGQARAIEGLYRSAAEVRALLIA
jgi:xylose dehydrogenase (NAD/NADP)